MENRGEICGKFENILWNCDVLRGIPQEILKVYTKKNSRKILKIWEILPKLLKLLKKWLKHYFWVNFDKIKERFCQRNFFKNFTKITYERILKKLKIGRRISHKNKHLPIHSLGLASLSPVRCLVCKRHRIYVCLFPKQIHFRLDSLGLACGV